MVEIQQSGRQLKREVCIFKVRTFENSPIKSLMPHKPEMGFSVVYTALKTLGHPWRRGAMAGNADLAAVQRAKFVMHTGEPCLIRLMTGSH